MTPSVLSKIFLQNQLANQADKKTNPKSESSDREPENVLFTPASTIETSEEISIEALVDEAETLEGIKNEPVVENTSSENKSNESEGSSLISEGKADELKTVQVHSVKVDPITELAQKETKIESSKTTSMSRESIIIPKVQNKNASKTEEDPIKKVKNNEKNDPEELKEKPKEKESLSRITIEPQPLSQNENKTIEPIKAEKNTKIESRTVSEEKIIAELSKTVPSEDKDTILNRPTIVLHPIGKNNILSSETMKQAIKISGTIHHLDKDVSEKILFVTINHQDYSVEWISETEFQLWIAPEILRPTSAFSVKLSIKDVAGNEQSVQEDLNYLIDTEIQQPQWIIYPITEDNILSSEELKKEVTISGKIIYSEKDIIHEKTKIKMNIQDQWIDASLNLEDNTFSAVVSGGILASQNEIQIKSEMIDQAGNELSSEIYRHQYQFKTSGSIQVDDFTTKTINLQDMKKNQTFTIQGHYEISQGDPTVQLTVGDLTVLAKTENGNWFYDFLASDLAVLNTKNTHQKIAIQLYDAEMNLTDSKELFYHYDTQIHVPQFSFDVMTLDNHLDIDEAQQYYTPIKGKFTQLGNDISVEHILFKMGQYQIENVQVNEQEQTFITFVPTELLMNHQEFTGYFTIKDDAGNTETVELKHEYSTEKHDLNGNAEDNLFLVYRSEALLDGQEGIDKAVLVGQDLSLKSSQFQNIEHIDLFGTNNHLILDQIQNDLTIRGRANNQVKIESTLWENLEKINENIYLYQINNQTFKLNIQSDIQII